MTVVDDRDRQRGVVAGIRVARLVFDIVNEDVEFERLVDDGDKVVTFNVGDMSIRMYSALTGELLMVDGKVLLARNFEAQDPDIEPLIQAPSLMLSVPPVKSNDPVVLISLLTVSVPLRSTVLEGPMVRSLGLVRLVTDSTAPPSSGARWTAPD